MEKLNQKVVYSAPVTQVVDIKMDGCILQGSPNHSRGRDYDEEYELS